MSLERKRQNTRLPASIIHNNERTISSLRQDMVVVLMYIYGIVKLRVTFLKQGKQFLAPRVNRKT